MGKLTNVSVIRDYKSEEANEYFTNYMKRSNPFFFGRVGGSDYIAARDYFNDKNLINNKVWYEEALHSVKRSNGYFDFSNKKENFVKYLDNIIHYYKISDDVSYCNDNLLNGFDHDSFNDLDRNFLNYILDGKTALSYNFIEELTPFLKSFKIWGENLKVLIVSPLSKSIQHQDKFRNNFFKNYTYPNFQTLTYNTNITYSNDPRDNKSTLNVKTDNWHEECIRMADDISRIDFDIAFLSCASYSMFLGNYIRDSLKKKSLYFGGVLNAYFNIYGGRFNSTDKFKKIFDDAGLDLRYQIDPLELPEIYKINSGRGKITESLAGYFGSKDGKYSFKKR